MDTKKLYIGFFKLNGLSEAFFLISLAVVFLNAFSKTQIPGLGIFIFIFYVFIFTFVWFIRRAKAALHPDDNEKGFQRVMNALYAISCLITACYVALWSLPQPYMQYSKEHFHVGWEDWIFGFVIAVFLSLHWFTRKKT